MIEVKSLTKRYGYLTAVNDISFSIKKGEIVGFLGPNGAGKTTTMKILTAYLSASSGEVKIGSLDIIDNSLKIRQKIGYLPEHTALYPEMNVQEYLIYVGEMYGMNCSSIFIRIPELVKICGLKAKLFSEISELSKGYKQRVGLAQALFNDPPILILDEPTTGLDPNQIQEIRSLIKEIGKKKTIILSTHILSEVEATCDRAIIINKGKIVAEGSPDELKQSQTDSLQLVIEVEGNQSKVKKDVLEKIVGIEDFKIISANSKINSWHINCKKGIDIRKELNHTLFKNKLELLEMQVQHISLENVFAKLTK